MTTTSAHDVARYLLTKQNHEAGEVITNLKLQKLLYYAQGFHLALYDEPLFKDRIEAWEHGPVVRSVWREYRDRGANPLPVPDQLPAIGRRAKTLVDEVYDVYGQFSAWRLRELSHQEPPWAEAYNTTGIVHADTMRKFFRTRLASKG